MTYATDHPDAAAPRRQWVRALTVIPSREVLALANKLTADCEVKHHAIPQSGLMLMRMTESVVGEDYYLGELPVSSASVELRLPDGTTGHGAAQVTDDRQELAVALAVCDAVMAKKLEGWREVNELIQRGMARLAEQDAQRNAMLAKTQVDFSIVSEDAEDYE